MQPGGGFDWRRLVFGLIAVLVQQSSSQPPANGEKECKWRTNLTDSDIETLPSHKYAVLEDCLYYFLSKKADKDYEKSNAMVLLPPTKDQNELELTIHQAMIRQMWMNEAWKEMHVNGYLLLSWRDSRLKWNSYEWKLDTLKIKSYGHLWVPDLYSDRYQTSVQANDFTIYQDMSATKSGNISARLEYRMQATCQVDYSNYPSDLKHCCFKLRSHMFRDLITYKILDKKGHLDLDQIQTNWDIKDISLTMEKDDQDNTPFIKFCLSSGRKSSTLRIGTSSIYLKISITGFMDDSSELTIPMVISAILVLVAPLFGNFRIQLYVKLFALLLQFLCFQFLVTKTPQLGFGDVVPKIYRFYEFTLSMTLVSLLVTLIISAITRMDRSLPPPHGVLLAASAVNGKLCCSEETGEEKKEDQTASTNYAKEIFINQIVDFLYLNFGKDRIKVPSVEALGPLYPYVMTVVVLGHYLPVK